MKILQLKLNKYKRMKLNNIKSFEYTPKEKVQIIIGTNGSGKSSLLHELSPIPAGHRNYDVGGSKYIKLEHKGHIFELTSDFEKGQAHSFLMDGVELNPGTGTFTVQKDLVEKYFGITQEIHELALGQKRFSTMSIGERRHWFTMLSDANYDYAIGVFLRLKDKARDASGALKIAKKRLAIESNKIMDTEEKKALEKKCSDLYAAVTALQENRIPEQFDSITLEEHRKHILNSIEVKTKNLQKLLIDLKPFADQIPYLENKLAETSSYLAQCQAVSDGYYNDHKKITGDFEIARKVKQQSVDKLQQEVKALKVQKQALLSERKLDLTLVTDPHYALEQIETAHNWLLDLIPVLRTHQGKRYDIEKRNQINESLKNVQIQIEHIKKRINDCEAIVKHLKALKNNDAIECPNCKHQWIQGYNEQDYQKSEEALMGLQAELSNKENIFKEIQELHAGVEEYFQAMNDFSTIVRNTDRLSYFWDYVIKEDLANTNPNQLNYLTDVYKYDLSLEIKAEELLREIKAKNQSIEHALEHQDLNFEYISKAKSDLEEKIAELQSNQLKAQRDHKSYQAMLKDLSVMQQTSTELEALLSEAEQIKTDQVETARRSIYNEMLRSVQVLLAQHETLLHEANNQQNAIRQIEEQIELLSKEEKCLKAAAKEISPTEGLVAEGLFGFMKLFIQQMNNFVKRIWTYPLVVQPCELGSDGSMDLDYKFPIIVDTADNVRKDISEGSTAMQEVIDLAFKITAMKALHLDHYPLYLDEFGSTMDPTHKAATIQLINSIMEQDHFTQLFLISHDSVQYGALSNTEVCVLSSDNMMLSKGSVYNQHVKIN